ncbi:MAG: hypothetical protein P9L99_19935 [Candidatus Lernaella stagnicola]|nr:hypothetical protein [Candidatus Lernaella stagnicola]
MPALVIILIALILPTTSYAAVEWMRYDSAHFGVFFPRNEVQSATAFAASAEPFRRSVIGALGKDFDAEILVYLAPDRETYESLQPGRNVPKWSVGVAYPHKQTIYMFSPSGALREGLHGNLAQTFLHEMSHVALFEVLNRRHPPKWLTEGVAQMVAQQWSSTDSVRLTVALIFDGLIPLKELTRRWPSGESRAKLAYAESLSFVIFLKKKGWLTPVLDELAAGESSTRALRNATGLSLSQLEKRWRKFLEREQSWLSLLNHGCIFGAMSLLAVFSWFVFRLRQRRRYETLDDDPYPNRDRRMEEPKKLRKFRVVKKDDRWHGRH